MRLSAFVMGKIDLYGNKKEYDNQNLLNNKHLFVHSPKLRTLFSSFNQRGSEGISSDRLTATQAHKEIRGTIISQGRVRGRNRKLVPPGTTVRRKWEAALVWAKTRTSIMRFSIWSSLSFSYSKPASSSRFWSIIIMPVKYVNYLTGQWTN